MIEFFIAKKQMLERKKQSILSIVGVFIGITVCFRTSLSGK